MSANPTFFLWGSGTSGDAGPLPPPPTPSGLAADPYPRMTSWIFGGVFAGLYSGNLAGCGVTAAALASQVGLLAIGVYFGVEQYGLYKTLIGGWKAAATANGVTLRVVEYGGGQGFTWTGADYITTLGSLVGGSGYPNGTYVNVPLTGGHGTLAKATLVVAGGAVTSASLSTCGFNYAAGDVLSVAASSVGGVGSGFSITVTAVSTQLGGDMPWLTAAFDDSSMWAYTAAAGIGTTDLAPYYGSAAPQVWLNWCPANKQTLSTTFTFNGKTGVNAGFNVWQLYAQYSYDCFIAGLGFSKYGEIDNGQTLQANPECDGFFIDNSAPQPEDGGYNATWNGIGTTPVGITTATCLATMQGDALLAAAFRALDPDILLWSNGGYAQSYLSGTITTLDPTYVGCWDVSLMEATVGAPSCIEQLYNSPPGAWMQGMIKQEQAVNANGAVIYHQVGRLNGVAFTATTPISQTGWGPADWQSVRCVFAAAMMRNARYCLHCGVQQYQAPGLTDEQVQTIGGVANYGWLSFGTQRLDPPQSGPSTLPGISGTGVWARRYPNGWVLCNFRGNGQQTVTVPNTLAFIKSRGYGDGTVNTGLPVPSNGQIVLPDGSGIFLIGTG